LTNKGFSEKYNVSGITLKNGKKEWFSPIRTLDPKI